MKNKYLQGAAKLFLIGIAACILFWIFKVFTGLIILIIFVLLMFYFWKN